MKTSLHNIPIGERIRLVEDLWDSIVADQDNLPLTDEQRTELDRRLDAYEADNILFNCPNKQALISRLNTEIPAEVPPRSERTKKDNAYYKAEEKISVCYLLKTLASAGRLSYPVCLEHPDRPDFILTSDNDRAGIEVTEAFQENYRKLCAMSEQQGVEPFFELSKEIVGWDSRNMPGKDLQKIIDYYCIKQGGEYPRFNGQAWFGDSVEIDWAKFMNDRITDKLGKLKHYVRLPDYWLLIHDCLSLPAVDREKAIGYLITRFSSEWQSQPGFSRLFIFISPQEFWEIQVTDGIAQNITF